MDISNIFITYKLSSKLYNEKVDSSSGKRIWATSSLALAFISYL
jgi:hypothetical protein